MLTYSIHDTIAAQATPPGKSGVAIIRISGAQAYAIAEALCHKKLVAREAAYVTLYTPQDRQRIDSGIALYFKAPHSFTGEDVIEFQVHGSMTVIKELLATILTFPYTRLAEAGEFTRRAFLNHKLDLTEIEGLHDLIEAKTSLQKKAADTLFYGEMGKKYKALRHTIVHQLALVEAYLDFPDEELPETLYQDILAAVNTLKDTISTLIGHERSSTALREGFVVTIAGAPNVGKSSLLNALTKQDAAIVSDIAGTTRDIVRVEMDIQGLPVTFLDTAGIHGTTDTIELEGIARAEKAITDAHLILSMASPESDFLSLPSCNTPVMQLFNKSDILHTNAPCAQDETLFISAKEYNNIDTLLATIYSQLQDLYKCDEHYTVHLRHRQHLELALVQCDTIHPEMDEVILAETLRTIATHIGHITDAIATDELLDIIFNQFCIGK